MVVWERADGQGLIQVSDELYEQACALGLGVPSVAWSDDAMLDFIEDPEAFAKKHLPESVQAAK